MAMERMRRRPPGHESIGISEEEDNEDDGVVEIPPIPQRPVGQPLRNHEPDPGDQDSDGDSPMSGYRPRNEACQPGFLLDQPRAQPHADPRLDPTVVN